MKSDLPKVLLPLAGRPLIRHVLDTAEALEPKEIYVVYGYGGAQVQAAVPNHVDWILQAQQLGTGHALMQAMPLIPDDHQVLVLYGDVPLLRLETLRQLIAAAAGGLALLTVTLPNPAASCAMPAARFAPSSNTGMPMRISSRSASSTPA